MEKPKTDYQYLGTLNSLPETPSELKKCRELKHEISDSGDRSCWHICRCDICQITWNYDSSG